MQYELLDSSENETLFDFEIVGLSGKSTTLEASDTAEKSSSIIAFDQPFHIDQDGFDVSLTAGTLYEDTELSYSVSSKAPADTYSDLHKLLSRSTPVHKPFRLSIDGSKVPQELRDKAVIVTVAGKNLASQGGSFENGVVTARVRTFGDFAIAVDDTPPRIKPLNISNGKNLVRQSTIRFQITDNLSGISKYRGEIDGEWVLFEHDAKYSLLKHTFDGSLELGMHTLTLEVTDQKGNVASYTATFKK